MAFKMKGWSAFTKKQDVKANNTDDDITKSVPRDVPRDQDNNPNQPVPKDPSPSKKEGGKAEKEYGPHNKIVGEQGKMKKEVKEVKRNKGRSMKDTMLKDAGKAVEFATGQWSGKQGIKHAKNIYKNIKGKKKKGGEQKESDARGLHGEGESREK